jgi:hypothetical protein
MLFFSPIAPVLLFLCRNGRGGKEPVMETLACRAVTQAALAAVTASLDDHSPERLLFVAGWLTTAADVMLQSALMQVGSDLDVLL